MLCRDQFTAFAVTLVPCLSIEMLHLKKEVYAYHYLNQSGCSYVLTMDDDQQFGTTVVSAACNIQPYLSIKFIATLLLFIGAVSFNQIHRHVVVIHWRRARTQVLKRHDETHKRCVTFWSIKVDS